MSPTLNQLNKGIRQKKYKKSLYSFFKGGPQRRAVVYKTAIMSPRKPNSARRTFAKVTILISEKHVFAKIPGIGEHFLQSHSTVLLRGGAPKDSPGINFTMIRGLYDFDSLEVFGRRQKRSKYGVKKYVE